MSAGAADGKLEAVTAHALTRSASPPDGLDRLDPPYARSPSDVARALAGNVRTGLSDDEAARRLGILGPNLQRPPERPGYERIAARQFADPLVALLLAAALVSAGIGEHLEAAVIAAIVVLNAVLGFVQEAGAERALHALRQAVELDATVIRGGRERSIAAAELVRGDLVVVREGDRVPADARIVQSERLALDESALTGESAAVEKLADAVTAGTTLAERSSMLFAGTGVTRGRGTALVTETGERTELARISHLADTAKPPPTPLQRQLAGLSRAMIALGLGVLSVLTAGMLARGSSLEEAFLVGVAVAVAAVPEGLAAAVTIALAQGARAMAARGAIVRRLAAVETLGSASLIATDKTGTLTLNQMRVVAVAPLGSFGAEDVLEVALLASTAELADEGDRPRILGDQVDGAILLAARERGLPDDRSVAPTLRELPFDPWRKRMTVVYGDREQCRVVVKGAPEVVLERSALDRRERRRAQGLAEAWAADGLRVLAVAERFAPEPDADEEPDVDLTLVGLVGLRDPLRPAAADSIAAARAAGIDVVMLTGDHPLTAATIAGQLGLDDDAVFARVTPADKLRLVEDYQGCGAVVAVTGDGVNDTPALRRADVGVAMGKSGTEAAREAADIVLTDDDFGTIVAAIREGRVIGDNVRKFVAFLLSANLGEIVVFAIAVLAGLGAPMTVVQVLTVNLLTDGLPAVALARDRASSATMRRGPRPPGELFGRALQVALGVAGLAIGLAATAAYLVGRETDPGAAQTMAFATIALAELAFVFSVRSPTAAAWRGQRNPLLLAAVAASALVVAVLVYLPPAQLLFGTEALAPPQLAVVALLALLPTVLVEAWKAVRRRARSRSRE
jgi:Ca2+-transporting ATPase